MFKNMRLVIHFDMFLNPSFKMTTKVSPIKLELQLAQVNFNTRKYFKSSGIGHLFEKYFLILNEVKISLMLTVSLQNTFQSFESLFLLWSDRLSIYGNLK